MVKDPSPRRVGERDLHDRMQGTDVCNATGVQCPTECVEVDTSLQLQRDEEEEPCRTSGEKPPCGRGGREKKRERGREGAREHPVQREASMLERFGLGGRMERHGHSHCMKSAALSPPGSTIAYTLIARADTLPKVEKAMDGAWRRRQMTREMTSDGSVARLSSPRANVRNPASVSQPEGGGGDAEAPGKAGGGGGGSETAPVGRERRSTVADGGSAR